MKRVYRATPVAGDYLAVVFIIVGLTSLLFSKTFQVPIIFAAWSIILGTAILTGGRLSRFELTDSRIRRINFLGQTIQEIEWTHVDKFSADGEMANEDDHFFQFSLHSNSRFIRFRDDLPRWHELRKDIETCLANCGNAVVTTTPDALMAQGRTAADIKKHTRFIFGFVVVWLILFFLFGALSPTGFTHHESLYRSDRGWVVRYSFKNTSVMNSITFDIEKTWLNGVAPSSDTGSLELPHGKSGTIDLVFPESAVRVGGSAKLHSWWQWNAGSSNGYHMQSMDVVFTANEMRL